MATKQESLKNYWSKLSNEDRHKRGRLSVEKRHQIALSKKEQNCFLTNELYEQFRLTKMNIRRLVREGILLRVRKGCYALAKPVDLNNIVAYMAQLTEQRRITSLKLTINTTEYGDRLRKHWADLAKKHMKDKAFVQKIFDIKKRNGTTNTSRPEQQIRQLLNKTFTDVYYQYKSEKYPYNCDFYVKDIDTYIELNFHWTHGHRPYDNKSKDCLDVLKHWSTLAETSNYYKSAVKVWTILDVEKLKTAIDNQLNYLVFYDYGQFMNWYNLLQDRTIKC